MQFKEYKSYFIYPWMDSLDCVFSCLLIICLVFIFPDFLLSFSFSPLIYLYYVSLFFLLFSKLNAINIAFVYFLTWHFSLYLSSKLFHVTMCRCTSSFYICTWYYYVSWIYSMFFFPFFTKRPLSVSIYSLLHKLFKSISFYMSLSGYAVFFIKIHFMS